jgi:hypothetical protein
MHSLQLVVHYCRGVYIVETVKDQQCRGVYRQSSLSIVITDRSSPWLEVDCVTVPCEPDRPRQCQPLSHSS